MNPIIVKNIIRFLSNRAALVLTYSNGFVKLLRRLFFNEKLTLNTLNKLYLHLCTVLLFLFKKTLMIAENLTIKLFGVCTKAKSGAAMAAAGLDAILDLTLRKVNACELEWISGSSECIFTKESRTRLLTNRTVQILRDFFAKMTAETAEFEAKWRGESDKERLTGF